MSAHVVLVHGLWYGPVAMWPLAHALQQHGYTVSRFGYASVNADWADNVAALKQHLLQYPLSTVHLLAHSLGGLLALSALAEMQQDAATATTDVRQLIMLGTPLQGSASAKKLLQSGITARMLGHSGAVLRQGLAELVPTVAEHCRLVMIAGSKPLGLGSILSTLTGEHDGTVAVEETSHQSLHEHVTVCCGHSGLLLSKVVQMEVLRQLRLISCRS